MSLPESRSQLIPMAEAARLLADLCERLDEGEEPTTGFVEVFNRTKFALSTGVDAFIEFDRQVEALIEHACKNRDAYGERARKLREARARFKTQVTELVESSPDLPFAGQLGRLAVQKSGTPALVLSFGEKELTPDLIEFYGIDQKYIREKTTYAIDAGAVKAALQAGEEIDWASLETRPHLRIRK
jgi:hypothetical protein